MKMNAPELRTNRYRWWRMLLAIGVLCLLVPSLVILYFLYWFDWNDAREPVGTLTSEHVGRKIVIRGDIRPDWGWPVSRLRVHGIEVANFEGGSQPLMLSLEALDSSVNLSTLLKKGDLELTHLEFDKPQLLLEKTMGKGRLQGKILRFDATGGSVFDLRNSQKPYPISASMIASNTTATLQGTISEPSDFKGLGVALTVSGADATDLFPLTGVALVPTPPYKVAGRLAYDDGVWSFRHFAGHMGDSDLAGDLTWDVRPQRPLLIAQFRSRKLDFDDLGGFIGAAPATGHGETVSVRQQAETARKEADPLLLPNVPLDISRLAAMDAPVEFTGAQLIAARLPLSDFHIKILLTDRLLEVTPVRFGSGEGDVLSWLRIDARQHPVKVDGTFHFRRIRLATAFAQVSQAISEANLTEGFIGGTAKLSGTGKSLREKRRRSRDCGFVRPDSRAIPQRDAMDHKMRRQHESGRKRDPRHRVGQALRAMRTIVFA